MGWQALLLYQRAGTTARVHIVQMCDICVLPRLASAPPNMLQKHVHSLIDALHTAGTVHPFNTLYTSGTRDMHSTGALVTRRDDKSFYVLAVTGGPVECLLYRPGEWTC